MAKAPRLAPVHPGEVLACEFLEPQELSAEELATRSGLPLAKLEGILGGEAALDADTALRLTAIFGTTPEFWVHLQGYYDLARARDRQTP